MSIRFSTEAANADIMGDDTPASEAGPGVPSASGYERPRSYRTDRGDRDRARGEARPGKDINAAGFIKDKDSNKP